ncbi:related to Acetyltransferase, GNAT family [Sporisorium reilianum f. sp. reilianum]|uniref:Related to Acetyltransferase, GNAT family n=1 Tax=Sporisorium reilianum f. sp. reilianum TaxID=72559 RepID=A0A2N8UL74_9BASI|nr:related to Acetyltransferase, GNAT family [Sporisorium reilianum f. sp. reilianum]
MFQVLRISDPSLSDAQRAEYAQRYTELRIAGLERSPHAFSTTVAVEAQLTAHTRAARLQEPQKTIFVCVNQDTQEWVGQVTLIGPLTRAEYDSSFQILPGRESATSPSLGDATGDAYWHMTALYVDDRIRGRGLARLLCEACFGYIGQGQLRIVIKPDNTVVVEMYKRMGFEMLEGTAALIEAVHASRDGYDRLPQDAHEDLGYTTRGGIVMVKRVKQ